MKSLTRAIDTFVRDLPDPGDTQIELWALTCDNFKIITEFKTYLTYNERKALVYSVQSILDNHWIYMDNGTNPIYCPNGSNPNRLTSGYNDSITNALNNVTKGSTVYLISFGGLPDIYECNGTFDSRYIKYEENPPKKPNYILHFFQIPNPDRNDSDFKCVDIIKKAAQVTSGNYFEIPKDGSKIQFMESFAKNKPGKGKGKTIDVRQ